MRYEDLVSSTRRDAGGMLEYLEVDASPETLEDVLAKGSEQVLNLPGSGYELSEIQAHRTVADPKATIGRWRRECRRVVPGARAGGVRRGAAHVRV